MVSIITIDGPSGAGKGTIARIISENLKWNLLDSGAIYRILALVALQKNVELTNKIELSKLALSLDVIFTADEKNEQVVLLEGIDVSKEIRTEVCGNAASKIAAIDVVRDALLQRQRDFAQSPGLVADGRDMGTVVFPEAEIKVYLTASAKERAKRRYKQLKQNEFDVNLAALIKEIEERDYRDLSREVAPLKPAEDAIVIDSSDLTIEQVVIQIGKLIDSI